MNAKVYARCGLLLFCLLSLLLAPSTVMAQDDLPPGVTITPIGTPTWQPVDVHVFSAPIGTAATNYQEFGETTLGLLPPPNHSSHPQLGVGPGDPHQPPYDTEMSAGLAAKGYHQGSTFAGEEFSNGNGVWIAYTVVPAPGVTGSSPDFAAGPIIPNSLFPITTNGIALRQGKLFDPVLAPNLQVPPLDSQLNPPFDVDGHSHFPFFITTSAEFGKTQQLLPGRYTYQYTMIDASGSGWAFEVNFKVTRK